MVSRIAHYNWRSCVYGKQKRTGNSVKKVARNSSLVVRICCFFLRQLQFFVLVILLGRALCISFVIRANYVVSIVQTTGNNSRRHTWCRCTFCAFAANKRKLLEQVYKCCALADNRLRSRAYSIVVPIKRRTEKITITSTATLRCK